MEYKFKIGDRVKVIRGHSNDSEKYHNKIGTIMSINSGYRQEQYCNIEFGLGNVSENGIWLKELKLLNIISEQYGIVKFLKSLERQNE